MTLFYAVSAAGIISAILALSRPTIWATLLAGSINMAAAILAWSVYFTAE